jgi:hypothetical protein
MVWLVGDDGEEDKGWMLMSSWGSAWGKVVSL